jgi:glycosyltransferase involved in cell wall biosynthesis
MIDSKSFSSNHLAWDTPPPPCAKNQRLVGKRVAMVTFSPYPFDPRPRRAIEALIREGAQIDLICLRNDSEPRNEEKQGIKVRRLGIEHDRRGKLQYAYSYSAFILISSVIFAIRSLAHRYDVVYVHNMPDILVVSSLIPKMLGAKVVLDLHDPMPELMMAIFRSSEDSIGVRLMKRLEKWSIARVDLVVTVSRTFARIFSSRSCRAEKIAVVMNSPDTRIFSYRKPQLRTTELGENNPFVIMYHGSLVERNGLDVAIEAFQRVRATLPRAELRIYGARTPFLDRMLEVVRQKGLEEVVHYLGPKQLEDLVPEIERCDLGVVPNHRNAFTDINTPTRIFEYLALGKPVIAPATSGVQDYFDRESLLFFEAGDSNDLARQIEYAFFHPTEVLEIVKRGQKVFQEHSWEQERETLINRVSGLLT